MLLSSNRHWSSLNCQTSLLELSFENPIKKEVEIAIKSAHSVPESKIPESSGTSTTTETKSEEDTDKNPEEEVETKVWDLWVQCWTYQSKWRKLFTNEPYKIKILY